MNIKNCPYCKIQPTIHQSPHDDTHWIECQKCGRTNFLLGFSLSMETESIVAWNKFKLKRTKSGLTIIDDLPKFKKQIKKDPRKFMISSDCGASYHHVSHKTEQDLQKLIKEANKNKERWYIEGDESQICDIHKNILQFAKGEKT